MSKITFLEDVNVLDKLEKVSKRRKVSQSQIIREFIQDGLRGWDC